eukprot:1150751-Pelagomonas_calceolata.AAC.1
MHELDYPACGHTPCTSSFPARLCLSMHRKAIFISSIQISGLHGLVNAAASVQQQGDMSASKKRKLELGGGEDGQQQQPGFAVGATSSMPPPSSRSGLMPPPRKRSEDDAWVLPRRGVQQALKAAGLDKDFKLEVCRLGETEVVGGGNELQGALMELYGTLIENAVQFGCSNARMRKVRSDMARLHAYLLSPVLTVPACSPKCSSRETWPCTWKGPGAFRFLAFQGSKSEHTGAPLHKVLGHMYLQATCRCVIFMPMAWSQRVLLGEVYINRMPVLHNIHIVS